MLDHQDHVIACIDCYLHEALNANDAAYVERHCESCAICKLALDGARKRLAALQTLPAIEPSEQLIQSTLQRIDAHDRQTRKVRRWFLGISLPAVAASALLIGVLHLYYLNLTPTPYDLRILGQNHLMAGSMASLRIRLLDRSNGQPMQGVPVEVEIASPKSTVAIATFRTNAEGTGEPRFQLPDWPDGDYTLRVVAHPGQDIEEITETVQLRRSWKLMLSSDKPVYQPGQTILIRSLALRRNDLKPVAGQEVTFSITDPKGNVIFKKQDVTSKYGIASAECPLASEILEGRYDIDCKLGDTSSRRSVEVKKYVLPKFKVDVVLDQPYYQPGQKVKATVRADYFFGKPVADGTVAIEATTTDTAKKTLAKFDRKTDKDGKAEFEFTLPKELIGREQDSGDARFALSATVTDTAGQSYERTVSRIVTAEPLHVEIIPENGQLVPGVANKVYLFVSYADGRPAKAGLTVAVIDKQLRFEIRVVSNALGSASFELPPEELVFPLKLIVRGRDDNENKGGRTFEQRLGVQHDFLVRTDKAVYNGGETMNLTALGGGREPVFVDLLKDGQTILTETLDPAANGASSRTIDLPPDLSGTIELCAYRFDASGLPVRKTRVLYVRPAKQLDIKAEVDRREYRPGGKATLRLTLTDDKGHGVPGALSLAAVDEAVFSVLDQMPGMERTFYLLEQELLKPVYAVYPWSPEAPVPGSPEDRTLFEQALFARTAQVRSHADRDALLRQLLPFVENNPRVFDVLQRPDWENLIDPSLFPKDVLPILRNQTAPHSLSDSTFIAKSKQAEVRKLGGLKGVQTAWSIFGLVVGTLILTVLLSRLRPPSTFWESFVTVGIIAILIMLLLPSIQKVREASVRTQAQNDLRQIALAAVNSGEEVFEGVRDQSNTDLGVDVPTTPANGTLRVRVREFFPETLLWRPEVITDDSGRASLDVELADSITTWRLSASAVTADGRLGATQSSIRVFQPFFVDLNLPVSLTRGDEVSVPVVVYNYLAKPQTVELKLEKGDWFELLGDATQRIELDANAIRSTSFRLRVRTVGEQTLRVTATGSGVADAIKKSIEVVPDGRRVETVANGALDNPARLTFTVPPEAIEGSPKMILKIYPSTFSQIVEGLDSIFRMPYGCFEQTSSTTYPNVLALDYLKRTKKSAPEIEAKARQYIHLGYQRLIGFEVPGGGFDWFGRPPANLTLTAYGLMEFQDMARVHDVDPKLIARTRAWLMSKRNRDGSWSPDGRGLHEDPTRGGDLARLSTTAYVAWAIFGGQNAGNDTRVTLDYLLSFRPDKIGDPYVLALVCNAVLALDPSGKEAQSYLQRLDAMKQQTDDGKRIFWQQQANARTTFYGGGHSGAVETTSLAVLALMTAKQSPATTRAALSWLIGQKDGNGTWHSTQATVLALKALVAATDASLGGDQERRIEIAFGPQFKKEIVIPANQADVMKQFDLSPYLAPGAQQLTITERTETGAGYQVAFRYHVPGAKSEKAEPLTIDLAYDRTELEVGGTLKATATVTNRMTTTAPMVILDLRIPGGFAIDSEDLAAMVKAEKIAKYQVTARQAIVYLRGLEPGKPLTLEYRLKATMPVKVTVAPARVYEYYDTDKQGRSAGAKLTAK